MQRSQSGLSSAMMKVGALFLLCLGWLVELGLRLACPLFFEAGDPFQLRRAHSAPPIISN